MKTHHYTTDELEEWKKFYNEFDETDRGCYHAPWYMESLEGNFETPDEKAELFVVEDGEEVAYYPFLRRSLGNLEFADGSDNSLKEYSDIVSSWYYGGPLTTSDELSGTFVEEFREFCRGENIVSEFVRFDPNIGNQELFPELEPTFNRETVPVDLTVGEDGIWENYESRNRRAIRQARDTPLETEVAEDEDEVEEFHSIYCNAMEGKDATEHYRFELEFFLDLYRSDFADFVIAMDSDDNVTVGGFIMVLDDLRGYHYLSASNPDYWDMRVNNLMYHRVVMHAHDIGLDIFDFQGGRPGVFKFKSSFSPNRGEFYISKRIHMEEVYDELVEIAGESGIDTESGYFPAYRVEQSN
ncbi:MAG: GNAT family N-acetyltransferase [Halobacteria archaeon]